MINELFLVKSEKGSISKNKNKLFLGDWCLEQPIDKNQTNICKYFLDQNQINFDYFDRQYNEIIQIIHNDLNNYHNTNYNIDFWKLFVGPFLQIFIHTFYDRYNIIKKCFNEYKISKININSNIKNQDFSITNCSEFVKKISHNDDLNEFFFYLIIKNIEEKTFYNSINFFETSTTTKNNFLIKYKNFKERSFFNNLLIILKKTTKIINNFKYFIEKISIIFTLKIKNKNNYENILIDHYFEKNFFKKLKKNINILDLSTIFNSKKNDSKNKYENRNIIFAHNKSNKNEYDKIFFIILNHFFPRSYLEDFNKNLSFLKKNNLNFHSKKIWLFGSQYSNDLFKLWLAKCSSKNKLLIFQHGGGQGMHKHEFYYKYDMSICDKFISWGWKNESKKNVNIGMMSHFFKKNIIRKNKSFLLLQTYSPARYTTTYGPRPTSSQWLNYFNDQFKFYNNLDNMIKDNSLIRIKGAHDSWDQKLMWKSKFQNCKINHGQGKIEHLLKNTKIVISSYNATTFLENFNYNIPTIIFWDPKYWKLDKESENDILELEKLEIFFKDPKLAAYKINKIWNNIEEWWNDSNVQNAISVYKNKYARIPTNPIKEMISVDKLYK